LPETLEQVGRQQVALPVVVRRIGRQQHAEAIANRDARCDNEERVAEATILTVLERCAIRLIVRP
jgi:pyrimidine deaminase RibD-like protein